MNKPVILCVDDEKIILDSLKNEINNSFRDLLDIEIAESAGEALELVNNLINSNVELPIIISDYIMPIVKGDEFLIEVHKILPDTKKIMLTGQATTEGVTNVINNAKLYRFIAKPWNSDDFDLTITEAFRSYYNKIQLKSLNLKLSELNKTLEEKVKERTKELEESQLNYQNLLDKTLNGAVTSMIKILMASQPEIFGKASRMRNLARRINENLNLDNIWEIEISCLFSQIGCLDLTDTIKSKISLGDRLSLQEQNIFNQHPRKTYELISSIPKFQNIAKGILNHLNEISVLERDESYIISAVLKVVSDMDDLMKSGKSELESIYILRRNKHLYDKDILNAVSKLQVSKSIDLNFTDNKDVICLSLKELKIGYVFAQHVFDNANNIIFHAYEEITPQVLTNIYRFSKKTTIKEPIFVYDKG